jgi:hypothetical protein
VILYVVALHPTCPELSFEPSVYRRRVPIDKEAIQSWWWMWGWSLLLVYTGGADWTENAIGVIAWFSRLLVVRCLMRSRNRDVLGADTWQLGVVGMPARLCPVGRKRSLMANLVER